MAEVKVNFKVVDGASKEFKNIENSTNNFSRSFTASLKSIGAAVVGAFAVSKITAFMNESVEAYKEAEQAEQKLTAALGFRSEALIKNSTLMQQNSLYGDEAVLGAQAMIGAFIKEEDQIKRLTQASMDLATAKGMDLTSAADLLTKSITSGTNALKRYGIDMEGAAGSTERVNSAVTNVEKAFSGMAKAMSETDTGKIIQIQNAIGDIKETLGKEILPFQLEWNKLLLLGAQGAAGLLEGYTKAATIAGRLMATKNLETTRVFNTIDESNKLNTTDKIEYLTKYMQDKVKEIQAERKIQEAIEKDSGIKVKKNDYLDTLIYQKNLYLAEITKSQKELEVIQNPNQYDEAAQAAVLEKQSKVSKLLNEMQINQMEDSQEKQIALINLRYDREKEKYIELNAKKEQLDELEILRKNEIADVSKVKGVWSPENDALSNNFSSSPYDLQKPEDFVATNTAEEIAAEIVRIEREKNAELKRLDDVRKQQVMNNANVFLSALGSIAAGNKKMIAMQKTIAIASIIFDTYSSASKAASQAIRQIGEKNVFAGVLAAGSVVASVIAAGLNIANVVKGTGYASGVNYSGEGMVRVGEYGPENVYLGRGSQVVNSIETRNSTSSTSNYHFHFPNEQTITKAEVNSGKMDGILREMKRKMAVL
jgi:hypothetical protein